MRALAEQRIYVFSDFRLDPARRLLTRHGETVVLHPKTFDVLLELVKNRGRLVSKNELLNTVWEGQFVEEGNLAVQISALRKIFGERKNDHRFIVTVPGRGYRFVTPVEYENVSPSTLPLNGSPLREVSTNGVAKGDTVRPAPDIAPFQYGNYFLLALGALLLVSFSALIYWRGTGLAETLQQTATTNSNPIPIRGVSARRVTSTGRVRTAALSSDGKMFLYSSGMRGETGLWLGHVDGGEHRELRPPANAKYRGLAFAPDGESVYFVVAEESNAIGALYKASVFGGVPQKLRTIVNTQIALAPDGKQFAYIRAEPEADRSSLVIADLTEEKERKVASRPIAQGFLWETPSWSADGSRIAVAASAGEVDSVEVLVVGVDDGTITSLTDGATWKTVRATEWSKDGSGVFLIASDRDSYAVSQLYFAPYPAGSVHNVNPDLNAYSNSLKLASSNNTLLTIQGQRLSNIWLAHANDIASAKQITFGSLERLDGWIDVAWSPDGELLHSAILGHKLALWKTDLNGGQPRQLTSSNAISHTVSSTDDGRFLVFESDQSGSPEIWRSNSNGEDARQLTTDGRNTRPHVSPDGRWIAFTKRDGFVWRMTIDGGDEIRLADVPARLPRFSPDSRYVACVYEEPGARQRVAILPIDGGMPVKLFDVPPDANFTLGVRWTPDSQAVTYRDWFHGIWRQDLDGSEPTRLPGLPKKEALYGYDWTRDGKLFAYARGQVLSDVVLITLDHNAPR